MQMLCFDDPFVYQPGKLVVICSCLLCDLCDSAEMLRRVLYATSQQCFCTSSVYALPTFASPNLMQTFSECLLREQLSLEFLRSEAQSKTLLEQQAAEREDRRGDAAASRRARRRHLHRAAQATPPVDGRNRRAVRILLPVAAPRSLARKLGL